MKLFKNKKNKALVAAVTMSLVMGVCGNALAESHRFYGSSKKTFTEDAGNAFQHDFNGVFDEYKFRIGKTIEIDFIYGGFGGAADVYNNHVSLGYATNGVLHGGHAGNGSVYNNTVTVATNNRGDSLLNHLYGGYADLGTAKVNTVIIEKGINSIFVHYHVVGGRAGGDNKAEENIVNIKDGTIEGHIYGGWAAANGTVSGNAEGNEVNISAGQINGAYVDNKIPQVIGGYSESKNAINNNVNITGGNFSVDGGKVEVYGGYAKNTDSAVKAKASGNRVTIYGVGVGDVYGGRGYIAGGTTEAEGNKVELGVKYDDKGKPTYGSATVDGSAFGGYGTGTANNNSFIMYKDSRVTQILYGGYGLTGADNNKVELNGNALVSELDPYGVVGFVYGGRSENGSANSNAVVLNDNAKVKSHIYGGDGLTGADNNKVELNGSADVQRGSVHGGMSGNGSANSNSVVVNGYVRVSGLVYGGLSINNGVAECNSVTLNGNVRVLYDIYAGKSNKGAANNNTAVINDGSVIWENLYGGDGLTGADNNKVELNGNAQVGYMGYGGNVYGSKSEEGTANSNSVVLNDSAKVNKDVYGGMSENGSANSNSVVMNGSSKAINDVYGGKSNSGTAEKNSVTLNGKAVVNGYVYSGNSGQGSANSNSVTLNGNTVVGGSVFSGKADKGSVNNNTAVMNNSAKVNNNLYGGYGLTGADNNKVELNGNAVVNSNVYGGSSSNGSASSNSVVLNDSAKVVKDVYGGLGGTTANNNSVELKGKSSTERVLVQGTVFGGKAGTETGNTVYLNGYATVEGSVYGGASQSKGNKLAVEGMGNAVNANIRNFESVTIKQGSSLEAGCFDFSVSSLINNGTLTLKNGDNNIKAVTREKIGQGEGTIDFKAGVNTVEGRFDQEAAYVQKNAELTLKNDASVWIGKNYDKGILYNDGIVNLNGKDNKIYKVAGSGTLNVAGGETNVKHKLAQDKLTIASGSHLYANGSLSISDSIINAGWFAFYSSSEDINLLSNTGTVNVNGYVHLIATLDNSGSFALNNSSYYYLETVKGTGTFIVNHNSNAIINGGFTQSKVNVENGTLTLKGASNVQNMDVLGGSALTVAGTGTLNITENLVNNGTVTMKSSKDNTLNSVTGTGTFNVNAGTTTVNGAFKQKTLNFTLSKDIKEDGAMLNLKGASADISLEDINTNVTGENCTHGTTVTLLSSEKAIAVAEEKLKINNETAKEATIETAVDGLSGAIGAIVGYNVSEKALKLTTNSYKLLKDTDVTKDVTLNSVLDLGDDGYTLNMQSDSEEKDSYNTLSVKKLSGNGKLAIDVDMAAGENDKINIIGKEANDATITLNSIFVRGELQAEDGKPIDNKVTVLEGNLDGINFEIGTIKTATSDNIYTFEKGTDAGKLKVTKVATDNIIYFLPGERNYKNVNTVTLTKDETVIADLGTTKGANRDNALTMSFNADKKLSGDNKTYTGAIVADGYTLKLQGVDEATPGVMTQFKTAATVEKEGTLEVADMKFVDNGKDIVNEGTLKLSGTNTINDITNDGNAELEGNNSITTVSGNGTFDVKAGETTVSGALTQKAVNVNGGKLALNGAADITSLKVEAAGAMEVGGALKLADSLNNAGVVTVKHDNTLDSVTGEGSFNVAAGNTVTVTADFNQGNAEVASGAVLTAQGTAAITGALKNAGTVSLNGGEVNELTNAGTANLNGSNTVTKLTNNGVAYVKGANIITSVVGVGTLNVEAGITTVNGAFAQKVVNVSGGVLELKAPEKSFLSGEVQGHAMNIIDGTVTGHVYGGLSVEAAHGNSVNITNGTVTDDVYGGVSYNGNAYNNIVNISGDTTVNGDVYGALAINNGTAYKNTVNISGGTIEGNVYGGINEYGSNSTHHDNVINVSGGEVKGTIYGASNKVEANNLLHVSASNDKAIQAGNIAYLQKLEFTMAKGYDRSKALLTLTGKEATSLNLNGDGSVVLNSSPEERLVTGDRVTLIKKDNDQTLALMDNGNAIFDDNGTMKAAYNKIALYQASPLYILKGKLELAALTENGKTDNIKNDLIFVAGKNILDRDDEEVKPEPKPEPKPDPQPQPKPEPKPKPDPTPIVPPVDPDDPEPKPIIPVDPEPQPDPGPDPKPDVDPEPQPTPEPQPEPQPIDFDKVYGELVDNVKTAMETRANGAALVNEAGDFLMKQGLSNAKMAAEANKAEGDSSMAPFVALGGGKLRYETGSHIDSKSWHGAVGLAKQVNGLTFGVAIQQGKSNYDAYVNKAHSEGNSKSVGGALFAEKKIANGLHFDAAVRGGRIKNDYNANVTYSIPGENAFNVRYNESSAFYGISLGGGKEFNLKNKDKVDVYGRYAWTHTGSSEATTNWKDELKFDGINSHRILLGSRYTHAVNERNELYAGLGWQYELGGKVKGSIYGYSAPEPSLKGSSGLLELGWKAAAEENMTVDLNLSGWTGKQRGVMAGVNMQWKF